MRPRKFGRPHQIRDEALRGTRLLVDDDRDGLHRVMPRQHALDFAELDPVAMQLYLIIEACEEQNAAVRAKPAQVPRLVKALARNEWMVDESGRSQVEKIPVAARQSVAADVELTRYTDRNRLQSVVQDVQRSVVDWQT